MKKQEILQIIKLNQLKKKNENLISLTKHENFLNIDIDEEFWFPNIPDLNDEFNILKKEIKTAIEENKINSKKLNQLTKNCKHVVRLQANSFLICTSTCVFCNKLIYGDNTLNANTIYNDINRNKNCIMFTEDRYDENYEDFIDGYKKEEIYDILLKILENKNDDEEIDLIQEIKKLNLDKCYIDERKEEKEYYILIIGGTNKENINENSFITNTKISTGINLSKLLGGLPKVNVELLENPETYTQQEFKNIFPYTNIKGYKFFKYTTIEELKEKLNNEKHVPFDIIINTSNIQDFIITNNKITTQEHNLKLKELFPNSFIIDIRNYNTKNEKELLIYLQEKLLTYDDSYSYISKNEYMHQKENSLEKTTLEKTTLEKTTQSIEKILFKTKELIHQK